MLRTRLSLGSAAAGGALLLLAVAMTWTAPRPAVSQEADEMALRRSTEIAEKIDRALDGRDAAPAASDAEFIRRLHLDLLGRIPTRDEARAFLDSDDENKRAQAVESLLSSREFSRYWAKIWAEVLFGNFNYVRVRSEGKYVPNDVTGRAMDEFLTWMQVQIEDEVPWPQTVVDMMEADGTLTNNPKALYKAQFFWAGRPHLNFPDEMARSLLGIQVSCARCHDHPFDKWTQEDYYHLAAFFVRLKAEPVGVTSERDCKDVRLYEDEDGELMMPGSQHVMQPTFLFGGRTEGRDPRTKQLGPIMAGRGRVQMSRNVVNRTWQRLMGRGFIEPLDGFTARARPAGGRLMDTLAREFVEADYSFKTLIRGICLSDAYQRAGRGDADNEFKAQAVTQLTGEQMFKSIVLAASGARDVDVLVIEGDGSGAALGFDSEPVRRQWDSFFRELRTVYGADRSWTEVTRLPGNAKQALLLRNSRFVDGLIGWKGGLIDRLEKEGLDDKQRLEEMFLAALSRRPTAEEQERFLAHVESIGGREGWADALWVLINSAEFGTRH